MITRILLTTITSIMLLPNISQAAVFEECTDNVSFSNGNTYKNISGRVVCHLRDNPTVKTRDIGLFKGKMQGKSIFYDASLSNIRDQDKTGKLYRIEHYSSGKLHGEVRHFDPRTGKLEDFMRYKNGHKIYSKDMKSGSEKVIAYPMHAKFMMQSGTMTTDKDGFITSLSCPPEKSDHNAINTKCGWSYTPGPKLKLKYGSTIHEMQYCKGRPCGKRVSKRVDGSTLGKTFINNKAQRVKREFFKNGKVKYEEITDKGRGAKHVIKDYFESGKPKSIAIMRNRKIVELTKYFQNGSKKYYGKINGKLVYATHFYDNGKKSEEYQFETYSRVFYNRFITRGKIINISRDYYRSGRLAEEVTWKDGYRARIRSFDENGKLEKDEEYYSDGSRK